MHEYPLQQRWPKGCGFGPDETKAMDDLGIITTNDSFDHTDFEKKVAAELADSRAIIFTAPDHVILNQVTGEITVMDHTWAAIPTNHGHEYRSRASGQTAPLSPLPLANLYTQVRKVLMPNWKIHALWYKRK